MYFLAPAPKVHSRLRKHCPSLTDYRSSVFISVGGAGLLLLLVTQAMRGGKSAWRRMRLSEVCFKIQADTKIKSKCCVNPVHLLRNWSLVCNILGEPDFQVQILLGYSVSSVLPPPLWNKKAANRDARRMEKNKLVSKINLSVRLNKYTKQKFLKIGWTYILLGNPTWVPILSPRGVWQKGAALGHPTRVTRRAGNALKPIAMGIGENRNNERGWKDRKEAELDTREYV